MTTAAPEPKPPHKQLSPGEVRTDWIPLEWALTPLHGKRAYVAGWPSNPYTVTQIQEELDAGRATGIGLLSGQHCNEYGLLWVDFDGEEAVTFIENCAGGPISTVFPPTLTIGSGRPGRMRMLFRIPNKNINRLPDKATLKIGPAPFEMLWRSRQGALCGAHPDSDGYRTTDHGGFEHAKNLPDIPEWLYKEIEKAYPSNKYRKRNGATPFITQNISINYEEGSKFQLESAIDEARMYLATLDTVRADDYEEWVAIGMALHQIDDSMLADWIGWSAQSDHFEDGCCEEKWSSFERLPGGPSPEGARGLKTLRAKAKEDGYVDLGGFVVPTVDTIVKQAAVEQEAEYDEDGALLFGSEDDLDDDPAAQFVSFLHSMGGNSRNEKKKGAIRNPPASAIADHVMPMFLTLGWRYDPRFDVFMRYHKDCGVWSRQEHRKDFHHEVQFLLANSSLPSGYTSNLINDVSNLLEGHLTHYDWNIDPSLLAFRNGVLELDDHEFREHSPENDMTWGLDFDYDPGADPGPIVEWLFRTQYGDEARVQVLRAWLRACLVGRGNELQRFLEVIGPGGRGKSTYANLCCALVGCGNYASTTLNQLEQSRFELSSIKDKRLTLINDSERYGGSAQTFKALTGGDSLRYEEKLKAIGEPFVYTGMVMVAANEPIQTSDPTSGLSRRRLTIEFNRPLYKKSSEARDMIKIERGHVSGYWKDYLPGLVNWVLQMTEKEMRQYLLDTNEMVPALRKVRNEILLNSNNLIDWLQSEVVAAPEHVSAVGKKIPAAKDAQERYCNSNSHLYASYSSYCEDTGSKAVGQKRFVNILMDCCKNQLDLTNIFSFSKNGRLFVKGLAVRASDQKFKGYPTILPEGKESE